VKKSAFTIRSAIGGTEDGYGLEWRDKIWCDFCLKEYRKLFCIKTADKETTICKKCLKSLREQIDAFRVLVLTGEDTK
jgi:hypothetical protein